MKRGITLIALSVFAFSACTSIPAKRQLSGTPNTPSAGFSHQAFDKVLRRFVDENGLVDYRALRNSPDNFEQYYRLISLYSPDSHPQLFETDHDRLAYWINAYNAAVIKIVLEYYPIQSVIAVTPPLPLFFMPDKSGFFFFQRPVFGGVSTSLYYLENGVIRERYQEPRVHFALNCASLGCPRLPHYAFNGNNLDSELDFETRRFFSESRNFRVDLPGKRVYLSSILDWYRNDFLDWLAAEFPEREPALLEFVRLYLDDRQKAELDRLPPDFSLEFVAYDWGLNERK